MLSGPAAHCWPRRLEIAARGYRNSGVALVGYLQVSRKEWPLRVGEMNVVVNDTTRIPRARKQRQRLCGAERDVAVVRAGVSPAQANRWKLLRLHPGREQNLARLLEQRHHGGNRVSRYRHILQNFEAARRGSATNSWLVIVAAAGLRPPSVASVGGIVCIRSSSECLAWCRRLHLGLCASIRRIGWRRRAYRLATNA